MTPLITKPFLIPFGDADPQGILYFARIFEMAHACLEDFWSHQKASGGWQQWFQNPEFAVPLRKATAEYNQPMLVGHTYWAELCVNNLGTSSVEFKCDFYTAATSPRDLCASVQTVHVFVDKREFKKVAIPDAIRQQINP